MGLDPKILAKVNPKYKEYFPDADPDEVWNAYYKQQYEGIIFPQLRSKDLQIKLQGYINLIKFQIEYKSKKRGPYDNDAMTDLIHYEEIMELIPIHEDFRYYAAKLNLTAMKITVDELNSFLKVLTDIQNKEYNSLDEFTKKRIQAEFKRDILKVYGELRYYYEVFGEDNGFRKRSS